MPRLHRRAWRRASRNPLREPAAKSKAGSSALSRTAIVLDDGDAGPEGGRNRQRTLESRSTRRRRSSPLRPCRRSPQWG
jgi:hypothetical protein